MQVAGGSGHSLARLSNGGVYAWGRNAEYQFGTGVFYSDRPFAVQSNISAVAGIAAGDNFSLAWRSDGTAYGWGNNGAGQLGMPSDPDCPAPGYTPTCVRQPTQITALGNGVAQLGTGAHASQTAVRKVDGTVWAFGWNNHGQLGNNSLANSQTPVQAAGLTGATSIAAGSYHTLALGTGAVRQTISADTADLNASYVGSGGDPVQTNSGVFVYRKTDVAIPGRGPSPTFTRFYNSSDTAIGALGQGWTHNYATRLLDPGDGTGALVLLTPEGRRDRYARNGDGTYSPPPASATTLVKNGDGTYTVKNPDQSTWAFNAEGKLTRVADRHGNASVLTYNGVGQLAAVADPAGRGSLTFAHDPTTGRMTSVTDWHNPPRVVQFGYDAEKRLQTVTDREGKVTTYAYECCGMVRRLTKITDANNRIAIQNTYDYSTGRVTSQKDARGQLTYQSTTFSYATNADGSKTTTVTYPPASLDAAFNPQQIDSYDPQGRITQRVWKPTSTETHTTTYGYDANFFTTSATDARGNTSTLCYDADYAGAPVPGSRGNLTRKIAPAPAAGQSPLVTLFKYDAKNNLLQTVPPKGVANGATLTCATDLSAAVNTAHAADFAYDASGTKLLAATRRFTDPELGLQAATTKYEYGDAANPGLVTRVIAPRGNTGPKPDYAYATTLTYHASGSQAGLLQKTTDPLGNSTTYGYDAVGRRTWVVDPMGNPPSADPAWAHTWTYTYDGEDRLRTAMPPPGSAGGSESRYDAVGNRVVAFDGNGQVTKYVFDERDSLTEVHQSPSAWTDPAAVPADRIVTAYQYDELGTLKRVTRAQGTSDARVTDYAYDGLKRLRRETQYPSWPTTSPTLVTGLTYDGNGNRLTLVDPLNRTTTFGYDNADRVTSVTYSDGTTPNVAYQYDANGNRTQMADGTARRPTPPTSSAARRRSPRRAPRGRRPSATATTSTATAPSCSTPTRRRSPTASTQPGG